MGNVGLILVGIGPWPYLEALSGPFELCHQETKWGIKKGHFGMKLGKIGHWP